MNKLSRRMLWRWWPILAVTYAMAMMQRMSPASLAPLLIADYQVGWAQLGYFSSAYLFSYMVLQIPAGLATDHFGPRKILLFSVLMSALGTGLMAIASSYKYLLLGRAVMALGDAMVYSVLIKATATLAPKRHFPLLMSLGQVAGYIGVGLATSPLLFLSTRLGLTATFSLNTLILIVIAALVVTCTSDIEVSKKRTASSIGSFSAQTHLLQICIPTFLAFGAYYTAYMTLFSSWGTVVFSKVYDLSVSDGALIVLFGVLGLAVGGVLNGTALSWMRSKVTPMLVAAILALILFGLLASLNSLSLFWEFSVIVTLIGLCFGGISNSITVNVQDRTPAEQLSLASALHAVTGNLLSGLLIPVLGGWMGADPATARLTLLSTQILCIAIVFIVGIYLLVTKSKKLALG